MQWAAVLGFLMRLYLDMTCSCSCLWLTGSEESFFKVIQPHGCQADDGKLVSFNSELVMSLPECPNKAVLIMAGLPTPVLPTVQGRS